MKAKLRHLSYRGRQGSGEYRRRTGPPEELADRVEHELRVRADMLAPIEVRAEEDGSTLRTVIGHAAVFDRLSEELGFAGFSFRERIRRGAFRRALDEGQDTAFLIEHDPRWPLARTRSGTLELTEDPRGLRTFARVDTRQSYAADLVVAMERRDVDQMSFGFTAGEDVWQERHLDDGTVEIIREIVEVQRLFDVSAVTFPAYPQTDVGLRAGWVTVAGVDLVDPEGVVYLDELRELAGRIHGGELQVSLDERAAVDAAYSRTDLVSPWMAERALRAVPKEPESGAADPDPAGCEEEGTPRVGELPELAARRRRLEELTITNGRTR